MQKLSLCHKASCIGSIVIFSNFDAVSLAYVYYDYHIDDTLHLE